MGLLDKGFEKIATEQIQRAQTEKGPIFIAMMPAQNPGSGDAATRVGQMIASIETWGWRLESTMGFQGGLFFRRVEKQA